MSKEVKALETRATDEQTYITLAGIKTFKSKYDEKVTGIVNGINDKIEKNTARVFASVKTELNKADADVIKEYFVAHSDIQPRKGDVFLITTTVEEKNIRTFCLYLW